MTILIRISLILSLSITMWAQTYHYRVKYGPVSAGVAVVKHDLLGSSLQGELRITSSPWLSNLWTLSDSIISVFDLEHARLIKHYKAIHEGKYHRNYTVLFQDSTLSINQKTQSGNVDGMYDLPSLLYHLSRLPFSDGDTLDFTLWDGKSYGNLTMIVEKLGKAKLLNPFPGKGWKLVPLTSTEKSREHKISLTVLFSENIPRMPTKIHIDTKYGELVMKLKD